MSRYFSSFFITTLLYTAFFSAILFSFNEFKIIDKKVDEKKISLNFVNIEKQKKQVKQIKEEKKPKKEVVKKQKKKKLVKKQKKKVIPKPKKVVKQEIKKEVIKEETTTLKKVQAKKEKKEIVEKRVYNYEQEFLHKNLLLIQKEIQKHVKYSSRAKRLNIQGEVLVKFKLSKNGILGEIETIKGHRLLRKSTIKAIYKASVYFPKVSKEITIKLPIMYKLI
ncbi:MAG: TonB family protein [Campylobacteraceae bacterium]|nr:TonB family protein [Campylobacteraceae bacterium]